MIQCNHGNIELWRTGLMECAALFFASVPFYSPFSAQYKRVVALGIVLLFVSLFFRFSRRWTVNLRESVN